MACIAPGFMSTVDWSRDYRSAAAPNVSNFHTTFMMKGGTADDSCL